MERKRDIATYTHSEPQIVIWLANHTASTRAWTGAGPLLEEKNNVMLPISALAGITPRGIFCTSNRFGFDCKAQPNPQLAPKRQFGLY